VLVLRWSVFVGEHEVVSRDGSTAALTGVLPTNWLSAAIDERHRGAAGVESMRT
jgi:hypothetical protein